MRSTQYLLFEKTLDEKFEEFLATDAGQSVYNAAVDRALKLKKHGLNRYEIKGILAAIRYDRTIAAGEDRFKINNNHASRLARRIMQEHKELAGFFETRKLSADKPEKKRKTYVMSVEARRL